MQAATPETVGTVKVNPRLGRGQKSATMSIAKERGGGDKGEVLMKSNRREQKTSAGPEVLTGNRSCD